MPSKKQILQRLGDLKSMVKDLEKDINEKYPEELIDNHIPHKHPRINSPHSVLGVANPKSKLNREDKEPERISDKEYSCNSGSDDVCDKCWHEPNCDDNAKLRHKERCKQFKTKNTIGYFYQEEQSLSDKRFTEMGVPKIGKYYEEDVKKAVKELKEKLYNNKFTNVYDTIDEIFGEKLI